MATARDLMTLSSTANGMSPETVEERHTSLLAMLVSGTFPDGTQTPHAALLQGATSPTFPPASGSNLPPPLTTGSTIQTFTDNVGDLWIAKNGVNSGAWVRPQNVLVSRWTRAAALPLTSGTATPVAFDTVGRDPYTLWATNQWTAPITGWYDIVYQTGCQSGPAAGTYVQAALKYNGGTGTIASVYVTQTTYSTYVLVVDRWYANAGDTFQPNVQINASGNMMVQAGTCYGSFKYTGTG